MMAAPNVNQNRISCDALYTYSKVICPRCYVSFTVLKLKWPWIFFVLVWPLDAGWESEMWATYMSNTFLPPCRVMLYKGLTMTLHLLHEMSHCMSRYVTSASMKCAHGTLRQCILRPISDNLVMNNIGNWRNVLWVYPLYCNFYYLNLDKTEKDLVFCLSKIYR